MMRAIGTVFNSKSVPDANRAVRRINARRTRLLAWSVLAPFLTCQQAESKPKFVVISKLSAETALHPVAPLIMDRAGTLYGTTGGLSTIGGRKQSGGSVISVTPPTAAGGSWTTNVLYRFSEHSGGLYPLGGLTMDTQGNLYGTTHEGSGTYIDGVIYELQPPQAGQSVWTEKDLYVMKSMTTVGLLNYSKDVLLGVTANGGIVNQNCPGCGTFFMFNPASRVFTTLYQFSGGQDGAFPSAALITDSAGNVYGTTLQGGPANAGTVFELTPPAAGQSMWTEKVLYAFQGGTDGAEPLGSLIMDQNGILYGTTSQGGDYSCADNTDTACGTVFSLAPPAAGATAWTKTTLHIFSGLKDGAYPDAGVTFGENGKLFGTTAGGGKINAGTVFELDPPPAGQSVWAETVLHYCSRKGGGVPEAALLQGPKNTFYGTTSEIHGSVFQFTP